MGSLTKALIGKEDCSVDSNSIFPSSFNRLTSTGSTMSLTEFPDIWTSFQYVVNVLSVGAKSDGATDDTSEIQAAIDSLTNGGTVYLPKGTSYYLISSALNIPTSNITILAEQGAEIRLSAAGAHGFNISGSYVTIKGLTMHGQGTYVATGTAGKSLILSSGNYTTIEGCYLKEAEQQAIRIEGDYANVHHNIIEGGPFYDCHEVGGSFPIDEVGPPAISRRQYYGALWMANADYGKFTHNIVKPNSNANAGMPIEDICCQLTIGMNISHNKFLGSWDHAVYAVMHGGTVDNNVIINAGSIKVLMPATGYYEAAVRGNVIANNSIDGGSRSTSPLAGDAGIILNSPRWSVISNNTMTRLCDAGILITLTQDPYIVSNNIISHNTIDGVIRGGGSDCFGIQVEDHEDDGTGLETFRDNVISYNIISNIGVDSSGQNVGIYIYPSNTANHTGNVIKGNTFTDITEIAMMLYGLTHSTIEDNMIYMVDSTADALIYMYDAQNCVIRNNKVVTGATPNYMYREETWDADDSANNRIVDNDITGAGILYAAKKAALAASSVVENNIVNGYVERYLYNAFLDSSEGDRTILYTDLLKYKVIRRTLDANRVDTTDTAANIIANVLKNNGDMVTIYIYNWGPTHTLTLANGASVTILADEGATDLILAAGEGATLTFMRTGSALVRVFGTIHHIP